MLDIYWLVDKSEQYLKLRIKFEKPSN